MNETIIISLGGSLIVPDQIDTGFLKDFRNLILAEVKKGKKFVIITGGGKICRRYQEAAEQLGKTTIEDLDWIGIASLKLNAELVRVTFSAAAEERVVDNLSEPFKFERQILIGSAFRPGSSSDRDAIEAAITTGGKIVINLSNIDYVYNSDPHQNPNAKKIEKISWSEYRKMIPSEWVQSGMNVPFDPIASKMAEDAGIQVVIMNGKPVSNLENYLNGRNFQGTIIQ